MTSSKLFSPYFCHNMDCKDQDNDTNREQDCPSTRLHHQLSHPDFTNQGILSAGDNLNKHHVQPPTRTLGRRLAHWGPITALSIIGCISMAAVTLCLQWWPPLDSLPAALNLALFLLWNALTISNLMSAAQLGPGYVPLKWTPPSSEHRARLQWCGVCKGYKAPRSHHCRQCNRCVLKMDHHCPWINNCVGHANQLSFVKFLFSAVIGCLHASWILCCSVWYGLFRMWYLYYGTGQEPVVELSFWSLFAAVFAVGLAIGVIFGVGFLFVVQIRMMYRNKTGIEDYIVAKAEYRRDEDEGDEPFFYPYSLGWKHNIKQVLTWSGVPLSNGYTWPVVDGCDQFTLTMEQIDQKREKRESAVLYSATVTYDGSRLLACRHGCRTCLCQSVADETRLRLEVGDQVIVTKATKYWLYGEVFVPDVLQPETASNAMNVNDSGDLIDFPIETNDVNEIELVMKSAAVGPNQQKKRGWFPRSVARREHEMYCEPISSEDREDETQCTNQQTDTNTAHAKSE